MAILSREQAARDSQLLSLMAQAQLVSGGKEAQKELNKTIAKLAEEGS